MSVEILTKFGLAQYFDIIAGAALDRSRSTKEDVIAYLLSQTGCMQNVVMVGDTKFDVLGAKAHGIDTIGVSWGYGQVSDMENAGAKAIAHSMDELHMLLNQ
jgi:phosphoglycolate phosphatase